MWASFDWATQVELETVLQQQGRLTEFVGAWQLIVKTAALRRAQSLNPGTIFASEDGLSMSLAAPMQAS